MVFCSNKSYTLLDIAKIIQHIFYKKYKKEIPLFIKGNHLLNINTSKVNYKNELNVFSSTPMKRSIDFRIDEIFDFLEKLGR